MYYLGQLLAALLFPPGLFVLFILLLAIFVIFKLKYRIIGTFLFFVALSMYITSIPFFAFYINDTFDYIYKPQSPPNDVKAAVVVLAGGVSEDENGMPFQPSISTMERLYAAVKLSKDHPSCKYLIVSGCDAYDESVVSVAAVMRDAAKTMDCHAMIIVEDKSRNTDENLKYCAAVIRKLSIKHVVIVTSNYHIARAMDFAYQYMPKNVKLYAYPSGGYENREIKLTSEIFLPDVQALGESCVAIKELIGRLVAKLTTT